MTDVVVASIGTTDPWHGAGLGLDLRALAELGARGVTVVAGVSAQDRRGIHAVHAVPPAVVAAQLASLREAGVAAYRIGALVDAATVAAVADALRDATVPIVVDPVLGASGGGSFGDPATVAAIRTRLVPLATVVTPNLREAGILTGGEPPADVDGMVAAGRALVAAGAAAALVTGGHLASAPGDDRRRAPGEDGRLQGDRAITDVLVERDAAEPTTFSASRLPVELRGTGCLLATALAVELARGATLHAAVDRARAFVRAKIASGVAFGGMRLAY